MASTASYASTPKSPIAVLSTANTNRNGTGTIVDIYVAPATGARIDTVEITALGTTTANVVRLFLNNGTTSFLWREVTVTAITPSTSTAVWNSIVYTGGLLLQGNYKLQAACNNAGTIGTGADCFNVACTFAGDF